MKNFNIKNIVFIFLLVCEINFSIFYKKTNKKIIFTFWEPKEKIPGYLSLCIKTWKKFLPEYKIILLDYQKVKEYLGEKMFSDIICKNMSVMVQTDAIRVAMLNKFGGIWMDADNIMTNGKFIKSLGNEELVMIWDKKGIYPFIAFIYASKNSIIINKWLKQIIINVKTFKDVTLNRTNSSSWFKSFEKVNEWFYLGNGILNKLIYNVSSKHFLGIDRDEVQIFPELKYIKNSSLEFREKYLSFFYEKRDPQIVLNMSQDLVLLQNSWTPLKYKKMSEEEFLKQDILLSNLLAKLLDIK